MFGFEGCKSHQAKLIKVANLYLENNIAIKTSIMKAGEKGLSSTSNAERHVLRAARLISRASVNEHILFRLHCYIVNSFQQNETCHIKLLAIKQQLILRQHHWNTSDWYGFIISIIHGIYSNIKWHDISRCLFWPLTLGFFTSIWLFISGFLPHWHIQSCVIH